MADYRLPSDGSVVIIDDIIEEAIPLMQLLSKNGIASVYYSGERIKELPDNPLSKVRLVFSDIRLGSTTSPDSYAGKIIGILDKIISDKNGPYVLAVWSTTDDIYAQTLCEKVLSSDKPPFKVINLKKSNFFELSGDSDTLNSLIGHLDSYLKSTIAESELDKVKDCCKDFYVSNKKYIQKKDALTLISSKLSEDFKDMDVFQFFAAWESCVNKISGKIVDSFSSLHKQDEYWQDNLRSVLYRMAYAEMGKPIEDIEDKDYTVINKNALSVLNRIFSWEIKDNAADNCGMLETIDLSEQKNRYIITEKINNKKCGIKSDINDKFEFYIDDRKSGKSKEKEDVRNLGAELDDTGRKCAAEIVGCYLSELAEFNKKLCIETDCSHYGFPGVVSKVYVARHDKSKLIKNYFKTSPAAIAEEKELDKFEFVELNVVPFCDHAQRKWITEKERLLPGLMIPEKYAKDIRNAESFYTGLPVLKIGDELYKCVFDFRLLKSADFKNKTPWYKIRGEVLADILSKLSNHANRIGVSFIEY